ncbi:MAG: M48 family metalloprotease [Phycisphaerales bacterium]|nr:M48 family metalloprotease [Phycisphaerales bacterium]
MAVLPVVTAMMISVDTPARPESSLTVASTDPISTLLPGGSDEFPAGAESPSPRHPDLAGNPETSEAAPPSASSVRTSQDEQSASASWFGQLSDAIHPVLPWAILVWLVGVTMMSVWHFGGWVQVRGMRRLGTRPAQPDVQNTFDRLLDRLEIRRPVRLLESVRVTVPVVVGWFRPLVLLPIGAVTGLTREQLEAILVHELAHVRRWDCLVQVLQAIMETLLFYHPGVWWVSRRIREESEQCCDDLAVGLCPDRMGYAHALVKVAELGATRKPACVAAATGGRLMSRIRRLVKPEEAGSSSHAWPIVALMAFVFASSMLLTIVQAQPAAPQQSNSEKDDLSVAGIAKLITQLGAEKFDDREQAYRELVKIGQPATAALAEATSDKDIERATRAKTALTEIKKRSVRFAIHLVDQPVNLAQAEKLPLDKLQLENTPLISDADVVAYDWDNHILHLTKQAAARLTQLGRRSRFDWNPPFVVSTGNERRYLGTLWRNHGASLPSVPMIYFKPNQGSQAGLDSIAIEPPSAPGAKDPRGDKQVLAGLKQLGRLRKSTSPKIKAPDVPWSIAVDGLQCRLRILTPTVAPHSGSWPNSARAFVIYELRNVSNKPIRLLPWSTPLTRMFTTDFRVLGPDGKTARYMGLCVSPMPPSAVSFIAIGPGQTLTQKSPLTYDFRKLGVYKIFTTKQDGKRELEWFYGKNTAAMAKNPDRVWTGKLASNTVTVSVKIPATQPAGKPAESRLEFRIVPNGMGSSRTPIIPTFVGRTTQPFATQALKDLSAKGPCKVAYGTGGMKLQWVEMTQKIPRGGLVVPLTCKYKGKDYVLLCDGDPYAMLPAVGSKNRWGLADAYTGKDAQGKPMIMVKFDKNGAKMFERLTKSNRGNTLAVIVDGKVLSSPVIQAVISTHAVITGTFTDQQAKNLARALKTGMAPSKIPVVDLADAKPPAAEKTTAPKATAKKRPVDSVVWDKPRRGWQAGAKLLSTSDKFKVGDSIVIQYLLKNTSAEKRTFVLKQIEGTHPVLGGDNRISLNIMGSSQNRHQHTLASGQVMEKRQYRVAFNTQGMLPGVYTFDSRSAFWEMKKDEPNTATGIGRYIPIRFVLSDPTRKTAIVYSKPPLAKKQAENIHWGKRVGGLVVGMRLPKGRTRWTNESRIEAELFIRNVSPDSISISYQAPAEDEWNMQVQTKDGKGVMLGRMWNTGIRRAVTRPLTIKPGGQVALTGQRKDSGPVIQVAKAAKPMKYGAPARLTTKQGSYKWSAYISVTQKKTPDLTMVVGSGPVPFEIAP